MRPILFYLPILGIPVYGYGLMLFLAFVLCSWLAGRLTTREGYDKKFIPDMALWLFVAGILGGRGVFIAQEWERFSSWHQFYHLWDGGLVLYGALFGGAAGCLLYWWIYLRKVELPLWKLMDIAAPPIALGIALGRIGCLLTGCCFGNVACPHCPQLSFPVPSAAASKLVQIGYQTFAGFTVRPGQCVVSGVEQGSSADAAGLTAGDLITKVNDAPFAKVDDPPHEKYNKLVSALNGAAPSSQNGLRLTVERNGQEVALPPIYAETLGVLPTQVFETISMGLLLFFLVSYYPYKTHDGSVLVLLMVGYGLHRFLNEMLRIDNDIVAWGLTFSQLVSIGILAGAGVLAWFVWRRPRIDAASAKPQAAETAAVT